LLEQVKQSKKQFDMPFTCISIPTKGSAGRTDTWRTFKPAIDLKKCTKCLLCWVFCPEAAIERMADDTPKIDYDYCKGCGICARECKVKVISMIREE